jgi:hypothetical protein
MRPRRIWPLSCPTHTHTHTHSRQVTSNSIKRTLTSFAAFMLAPLSRSSLTISSLPSPAALIRAVESYWGRGREGVGEEGEADGEEGTEGDEKWVW